MPQADMHRHRNGDHHLIENRGSMRFPCIRNCCLNDDDICLGCFRSLEEITQWAEADDHERVVILEKARQRREAECRAGGN